MKTFHLYYEKQINATRAKSDIEQAFGSYSVCVKIEDCDGVYELSVEFSDQFVYNSDPEQLVSDVWVIPTLRLRSITVFITVVIK